MDGNLVDGNLRGQFKQGRNYDITFYKLTGDAINRLNFEGAYRGNLAIDEETQLPLVLHVAVLAEGYLATLDSPRQQSYGIPVSNLQISDEALQFNSPMLQASYRGSAIRGGYQGEFKQGATLPLTLLKMWLPTIKIISNQVLESKAELLLSSPLVASNLLSTAITTRPPCTK